MHRPGVQEDPAALFARGGEPVVERQRLHAVLPGRPRQPLQVPRGQARGREVQAQAQRARAQHPPEAPAHALQRQREADLGAGRRGRARVPDGAQNLVKQVVRQSVQARLQRLRRARTRLPLQSLYKPTVVLRARHGRVCAPKSSFAGATAKLSNTFIRGTHRSCGLSRARHLPSSARRELVPLTCSSSLHPPASVRATHTATGYQGALAEQSCQVTRCELITRKAPLSLSRQSVSKAVNIV